MCYILEYYRNIHITKVLKRLSIVENLTYQIMSGNEDGKFELNVDTVVAKTSLDKEVKDSYELSVSMKALTLPTTQLDRSSNSAEF